MDTAYEDSVYGYKILNGMTDETFIIYSRDKSVLNKYLDEVKKAVLTEWTDEYDGEAVIQNAKNFGVFVASDGGYVDLSPIYDEYDSEFVNCNGNKCKVKYIGRERTRF